ncbi:MAG: hypothetical protein IJP81_02510 [Bacteroidales bacterium]|jgi:hypothetical protein|nr:hypothetical protein [Bacteroidales bacterium]
MANINDYIQQLVGAAAGKVEIPAQVKDQVLNGLSSSILGSLTQTVTKPGGMEEVKNLLTGKINAASSPVTALAGNIFNANVLSKLNLGKLAPVLAALIPGIMSKLSGIIKDQDGDGDVDINDILLTLKGGNGAGILGAATSILGSILGGRK